MCLSASIALRQDIILHECTPRFDAQTLKQHLGDIYEFYSLPLPSEVISPHHLGLISYHVFMHAAYPYPVLTLTLGLSFLNTNIIQSAEIVRL